MLGRNKILWTAVMVGWGLGSQVLAAQPTTTEPLPEPAVQIPEIKSIDQLGVDIYQNGPEPPSMPPENLKWSTTSATGLEREWDCSTYPWQASALCHRPVYFEDVALERYGHGARPLVQPARSAARFFTTIPLLPVKMVCERPREHIFDLGYFRPGDEAPHLRYRLLSR